MNRNRNVLGVCLLDSAFFFSFIFTCSHMIRPRANTLNEYHSHHSVSHSKTNESNVQFILFYSHIILCFKLHSRMCCWETICQPNSMPNELHCFKFKIETSFWCKRQILKFLFRRNMKYIIWGRNTNYLA